MTVELNFEWDPAKARANRKKHGVSFEQAATVFRDSLALTIIDEDHNEDEDRWITQGIAEWGGLLVVVHTFRQGTSDREATIRIISARQATRREQRNYEANL